MIRSRVVLSIAAAIALTVALAVGAPYAGAAGHRGHSSTTPRVETPRGGALVTKAALKVRVRAGKKGFQALTGSRDVTRRFHRRDSVWQATLRRGRDFELGENRLQILTKGGIGARTFLATKPRKGLLKVRRLPTQVSLTALPIRGWTKRRIAEIRVNLNGHRVPERLWPEGLRSFEALLGADDGVRFGRNRLVVTAVSKDDRSQTVRRSFEVTRRAPLAGAGADRHTKTGRQVRLDGSSTKAPHKGKGVSYRWRIVRAPKGSKAKLRHVHSAHPLLTPDVHGRYVVRLVASSGRPARKPPAATASVVTPPAEPLPVETGETEPAVPTETPAPVPGAPGGSPPPAEAAPAAATDQTTVVAAPAIKPIGMPIQTIVPNGGIELGGTTYTTKDNWVQVLVLDRQTLEITQNLGFNVNEASQLTSKLAEIKSANPYQLVIMSGGDRSFFNEKTGQSTNGWSLANETAIEGAMAMIGGGFSQPSSLPGNLGVLDTGAWSTIGVLGTSRGSATQNWGNDIGSGEQGDLHGYLQMDHYGNFGFTTPEVVGVNTNVTSAKEGSNEVQVGEHTYSSANLAPGYSGFQVVVLDSELNLVKNETFTTNTPGGDPATGGVIAMREMLDGYQLLESRLPAELVIVQSIGTPGGYDKNWLNDQEPSNNNRSTWGETLAGAIGAVGGPAAHDQFAQLIGSTYVQGTPVMEGGYSLVASTGLVEPFEGATSVSQAGSRLPVSGVSGVLTRNRDTQWEVQAPASPGTNFQPGLLAKLAYQPETPFPYNTGPYLQASEWFAEEVGLSPAPDVRTAYYENSSIKWNSVERQVRRLTCPTGKSFTVEQCETLKGQLAIEFPMVAEVEGMVESWANVFSDSSLGDYVDLQQVSAEVLSEIEKYRKSIAEGAKLSVPAVYEAFFIVAQAALATTGFEEVEPAIGMVAAGFGNVSGFSANRQGEPSTNPIKLPTGQLGSELVARYKDMADNLGRVGAILVSDWGKLQQASKWSNGLWALSAEGADTAQGALQRASEITDYSGLLPAAFGEYVLQSESSSLNKTPWEAPWNYRCQRYLDDNFEPFAETNQNPGSFVIGARTYGPIGKVEEGKPLPEENTIRQVRIISSELEGSEPEWVTHNRPDVLPQSIGNKLFAPVTTPGGLGIDQFHFFADPEFQRWGLKCHEGERE